MKNSRADFKTSPVLRAHACVCLMIVFAGELYEDLSLCESFVFVICSGDEYSLIIVIDCPADHYDDDDDDDSEDQYYRNNNDDENSGGSIPRILQRKQNYGW